MTIPKLKCQIKKIFRKLEKKNDKNRNRSKIAT